ncbi:MAG: GTPase Era [Thermoanaerobacteraceae bacterium]|uniref:GTPase Era n=1 Tax=Thermanaeromonas sp. C210 TaxID=2731925 RepID=UPI00155BA565|nr:GTPase Era [Thermanaeromonas sp. C210]MBE3580145.1 GTPase Era [Thermoanaerobacteraceae bacterium]GFN22507.1 GTPase Era [Thermanaeromonas sp. C210]
MAEVKDHRSGFAGLIGRPNAGKSTLLNALVGQKVAIISDKPQTTRNRILGVYTAQDAQIVFLDTPGIHKPHHRLGEYMVSLARQTLKEVDVVVYVVDVSVEPGAGEEYILGFLKEIATPVVLVFNKIDLINGRQLDKTKGFFYSRFQPAEAVAVSALQGLNVDLLPPLIIRHLPPGPQYYPPDQVTDQPENLLIAELIREKILLLTEEEVPHAVAVVVEEVAPRPNNMLYVAATVYVERDSQKGILIGKGGRMLKEIGTLARRELEGLLGNKMYLDLRVKVKKNWRKQETALKQLGYVLAKGD